MKKLALIFAFVFIPLTAQAELQKEMIEYKQGDTVLEGYFVYDDAVEGKRPGIIVVHDWLGFAEYGRSRADQLAGLGYVALAVDIYGKGIRPANAEEAAKVANVYKTDRALLRERVRAGFNELKKHPLVDPSKTGAIGYCFGGTTVLELARSGADVTAVVSFHGGLSTPTPQDASNIKSKVLILHGADDPYVPDAEVAEFKKEMDDAAVDWDIVYYNSAVHSFTRPDAGNDNSTGAAYNEEADKRSWEAMKQFFGEIFQ